MRVGRGRRGKEWIKVNRETSTVKGKDASRKRGESPKRRKDGRDEQGSQGDARFGVDKKGVTRLKRRPGPQLPNGIGGESALQSLTPGVSPTL